MLKGASIRYRFRSMLRFYSTNERDRILRYLNGLPGEVHAFENSQHPFPSPDSNYGILIVDFNSSNDRDEFDAFTKGGFPARLPNRPKVLATAA